MLAATLSLAAPLVFAQNIATVNGKPVPKARVDAMLDQILKQPQQPGQPPMTKSPELEQKVKDEIVLREIFLQEAERRGLQATADYKTQMEFARQSILIRALFQDFEKKSPTTDAEARAEYDKIKAANGDKEYRARHILVEKEEDAKALIAQIKGGAKFEDVAKKNPGWLRPQPHLQPLRRPRPLCLEQPAPDRLLESARTGASLAAFDSAGQGR